MHPILPIILLLLFVPKSYGDLIEFSFSGQVINIVGTPAGLWGDAQIGDPWVVTYSFDSESPDLIPSPFEGYYVGLELSLSVGAQTLIVDDPFIIVTLGVPQSYEAAFQSLPQAGGDIELFGFDVFDSDDLPTHLDLGDFSFANIEITSFEGVEPYLLAGNVLSFSSRVIPAPGGAIVIAFGALVVTRSRSRTRRSACQVKCVGDSLAPYS